MERDGCSRAIRSSGYDDSKGRGCDDEKQWAHGRILGGMRPSVQNNWRSQAGG